MASESNAKDTPRRIIIRAHEHWHNDYQQIVQNWLQRHGYADPTGWTRRHYVHLLGVNDGRFHIVININKNSWGNESVQELPYELYRLRKPIGSTG